VDASLDVVGAVWGLSELGVGEVFCGTIAVGDGTVSTAHGELPVPAPATLRLLEGLAIRPGPPGSGELVTPTGAALVRALSKGPPPGLFTPVRTGYGAGTREFTDRPNALRITIAEVPLRDVASDELVEVVTDVDDMTPEYLAAAVERIRAAGALDVVLLPTIMKRGRPAVRIEALTDPANLAAVQATVLTATSAIGLRCRRVDRVALPRIVEEVAVEGHPVAVKFVTLPNGPLRAKPEFEDVQRVALATARTTEDIYRLALDAAERAPGGQGRH
jgi:uncharacterized protein (DUF111 family)